MLSTMVQVSRAAELHGGLFTTGEAHAEGVHPNTLTRLVKAGAVDRYRQGVYRLPGTLETEHDDTLADWLALGGAHVPTGQVPQVVAAGQTAANLHEVGDFLPFRTDFIVPRRRGTRLSHIRLRIKSLVARDVTYADRVPTLTVEAMIADLFATHTDVSLIADTYSDALRLGKITRPERLEELLRPFARRYGHAGDDGAAVLDMISPAKATA